MRSPFRLLLVLIAILALAGSGSPVANARASASKGHAVKLDPKLPVQPYLQYAAQADPQRRVRVIVQKTGPNADSRAIAKAAGASVEQEFPFIRSLVLEIPLRAVLQLGRLPGVRYVTLDGPVRPNSIDATHLRTTYEQTIGVPAIWDGTVPATGKGVTVAVLDTGANPRHPDLRSNLTTVVVNVRATTPRDANGHGTHVTGIIKGVDAEGRYIGVAPDASVVSVQIADDQGASTEASPLAGLEWVYAHKETDHIRAINLSMSGAVPTSYNDSPLDAAVEALWRSGVVVVVSAGNRGGDRDAVWSPPGNDPFVISVGALDDNQTADRSDDSLASFSSRGLTEDGFAKPDVVAPGRKIVAPLAGPNVTLAQLYPDRITDTNYIRLSGTSMAAPVVTGTVALLLQRYPNLTPDQVKWLLMQTATSYPGQTDGAGLIDPVAAFRLLDAGGTIGRANGGIKPSSGLSALSGIMLGDSAYWDSAYWDSAYWDSAYWDSAYWDSAYWDSAYWDSAYWDSADPLD